MGGDREERGEGGEREGGGRRGGGGGGRERGGREGGGRGGGGKEGGEEGGGRGGEGERGKMIVASRYRGVYTYKIDTDNRSAITTTTIS